MWRIKISSDANNNIMQYSKCTKMNMQNKQNIIIQAKYIDFNKIKRPH